MAARSCTTPPKCFANDCLRRIFYIVIAKLQSMPGNGSGANNDTQVFPEPDDVDECRYYLQTTRNLLRYSSENTWLLLANQMLYADDERDENSSEGKVISGKKCLKVAYVFRA